MGDNLIGHVLNGRYEIQKPLGEDEMSWDFEAHDSNQPDHEVTVKVIKAKYTRHLEAKVRRIAGLRHRHILSYEWGKETIDGVTKLYLVAQLVRGNSLDDRLKKGRLSLAEIECILKEICAALGYAHDQHVLHLGLKPSNILFDEQDHVLVAGLGVTDLIQKAPHSKADADMVAQDYAPPEQSSGDPTGPWSDVYSLGIILHQMLTRKLLKQEPIDEGFRIRLKRSLPGGIRSVVGCAIQPDPERRYRTAGELAQAFAVAVPKRSWPRYIGFEPAVAVAGVIIAVVTCIVQVMSPELRRLFGFESSATPSVLTTTGSTAPPTLAPTPTPTFIPPPTLTLIPTPSPTPYVVVSVEQSHIHAGPGENCDELGTVYRGDQLPLCGRSEDGAWLQVDYFGMKGWLPVRAVKTSVELTVLPIVRVTPSPPRIPAPTAAPSLPRPNTAVRLQNPGFQRVQENVIPGWLWWAEDNFEDNTCRSDPCFDTPFFSQTSDPDRVIDGPTLQVEATAFVGLKVYILQTASVSPTVPVRFQTSAKAYSDLGGVRLAVGIEPDGSPDCSQARWGDTLLVDQSHGTVRLVTPTVVVGQAGRVTVCLCAESVYPARSNAAFFDNAVLIANPE